MYKYNLFVSFLSRNKTKSDSNIFSSCNPKGAFYITPDKLEEFYKLYSDALSENNNTLYIVEKCLPTHAPIRIDLDFLIERETLTGSWKYTQMNIKKFVIEYKKVLELYINVEKIEKYTAYIFEKDVLTKKSETRVGDGIHIVFPEIITPLALQYYIRDQLLQENKVKECFPTVKYINSEKDVFDKDIIGKCWTLYGSAGKPRGEVYNVTKVLNLSKNDDSIINEGIFEDNILQNIKLFSILNKKINILYKSEDIEAHIVEWYHKNFKIKNMVSNNNRAGKQNYRNLKLVRELLGILDPKRAVSYGSWIRVCWLLYNLNSDVLFDDFVNFSAQCRDKFSLQSCKDVWSKAGNNEEGLYIGTLHYWAKEDNYEKYKEIIRSDVYHLLETVPDTPVGVAKVLYEMYKYEFICAQFPECPKEKIWFQFRKHYWVKGNDAELRTKIYDNLHSAYAVIKDVVFRKKEERNKKYGKDKNCVHQRMHIAINKVMKKLEETTFIDKVLKESSFLFLSKDFHKIANSKSNLIGFNNGIYDLKNFEFRNGYPDDYITMNTNIDYISENDIKNNRLIEVSKFFEDILPNPRVRDYCLYILSTCLFGENEQQKIYLFTGAGGNGKSILDNLVRNSFGDYHTPINVAYITQKRASSNQASPEVMNLLNKRVAVFTEPDKGDTLNMGILKALSGQDEITARPLFGKPIKFVNKAKLILMCNDLPVPSSHGQAENRRFRVINFPINFVDSPEEPNERKAVPLDDKIPHWRQPFMTLLIKYYKHLKKELNGTIPEPNEVKEYTEQFQERTNVYLQFARETIIKGEITDSVSGSEVFQTFKVWWTTNYPGSKISTKADLVDFLKKKYKTNYVNKRLKGYKVNEDFNIE